MVEGMGIVTFTCDSFHSIDTWLSTYINKNIEPSGESRKSFDIAVTRILQPSVNYLNYLVIISKFWKNDKKCALFLFLIRNANGRYWANS